MSINQLPSALQVLVQDGTLDRVIQEALKPKLGFRSIAERVPFSAGIGETLIKNRDGLRPIKTTPIANAGSDDLNSGMTASDGAVEQYSLTMDRYGDLVKTELTLDSVAISSTFLKNARNMAVQSVSSVDALARDALFEAYSDGNTEVKTTLSATGDTITVLNVAGFKDGQAVKVGDTVYTLLVVTPTSGTEGTLKFATSVSVANGTAGRPVVNETAGLIVRPNGKASASALLSTDLLTASMILAAKAKMESNAVPGPYVCFVHPEAMLGLYHDPMFQAFHTGAAASDEWKDGEIERALGVKFVKTNMALKNGNVFRSILVGQDTLIEGVFTNNAYANQDQYRGAHYITFENGIAQIVRAPLDVLGGWISQAWLYIGGFAAPVDKLATSANIPTSNGRAYKRAIVLEHC